MAAEDKGSVSSQKKTGSFVNWLTLVEMPTGPH
jgi:hypothetical protein